MMKKSTQFKKILALLLCFINTFGQIVMVSAEDKVLPAPYDIEYLVEAPTLTNEGVVTNTEKYLVLGKEHGVPATIKAPFGAVLEFPYIHAIPKSEPNNMRPSAYILSQLTTEFDYTVWDLPVGSKLQLPTHEGYELHVGDTIGLPEKAFWGIRKLSNNPYDENFALEHTFGYITKDGDRIWAVTKRGIWDPELYDDTEYWKKSETDINKQIYWKEKVTLDIENISPFVNGDAPDKAMSVNENNTGEIKGILAYKEGELGNNYDLLSGIEIVGAVSNETLELSDDNPTPDKHFKVEHDLSGIGHLITDNTYTGIGSGNVTSKVTDYEDDATIFTQNIIVSTSGKPEVNIYHAGTDTLYGMEWMSNDKSADEWRRKGLDLEAISTINGTYDLVTRVAGLEAKRGTVTKSSENESVASPRVAGWKEEDTSEQGVPVTSVAYLVEDYSKPISAESDAKYMRFDSTLPTISKVDFVGEWESVTSHDAKDGLSGLNKESGGVHYLFVKREAGGTPEEIVTPTDGTDWKSLKNYKLPTEAGEYDLYVYAKDDATNRSKALPLNKKPIIVYGLSAKVRLEKKVADNGGNETDIFVIHLEENSIILGSVALKRNETSGWMSLDMNEEEFRTIKVTEVVPMDYAKGYRIYVTDGDGKTTLLDEGEDKVTLEAGDEITITIENEFEHAGYFRDKIVAENIFENRFLTNKN